MSGPLYVYGNWAAYDELSDGIELTEELAMRQMDELLRLRRHGVRFDAYLMDAFWYSPEGGYREWRRPHWPNGPDRWLDACHEHGLLPGLWFTANTLMHLDPAPAWRDSVDERDWGMCLFEGGFLADFLDVLSYWYDRGVRLFKFDFAEFGAVPAGRQVRDARARNISAFRSALRAFRKERPEAVLLAYNGFEEAECMDRTDRPLGPYVDPAWLEVFDSMYSGDPRPSDVPCGSFWRSVDVYSDHMTRLFEGSGIPLERIENCGFMAGPTGTCYWRGKRGWKGMLLLSLARGGRVHVAYGDLSLFTNEDAAWWGRAQQAFSAPEVRSFGAVPGQGEPYGWQRGDLVLAVNPGIATSEFELPPGAWQVAGYDSGPEPDLQGGVLTLAGGQLTLLSAGAPPELPIGEGDEEEPFERLSFSDLPVSGTTASLRLVATGRFRISAQLVDASGDVCRVYPPQAPTPPVNISVEPPASIEGHPAMVEGPIWSGLSWAVIDVACPGPRCDIRFEIPDLHPAPSSIHVTVGRKTNRL